MTNEFDVVIEFSTKELLHLPNCLQGKEMARPRADGDRAFNNEKVIIVHDSIDTKTEQ